MDTESIPPEKKDDDWRLVGWVLGITLPLSLLLGYCIFLYLQPSGYSKTGSAKVGVQNLGQAVDYYYQRNQKYPDNLEQLTVTQPDGGAALLPKEALVDLWGQSYQYDPTKLHPKTHKPYIYSQGEPGANDPIANWK
jgi:hypothetical protein